MSTKMAVMKYPNCSTVHVISEANQINIYDMRPDMLHRITFNLDQLCTVIGYYLGYIKISIPDKWLIKLISSHHVYGKIDKFTA